MLPKATIGAALLFVAAVAPVGAQEPMSDRQIAHTAYTAGAIDIRYAHLALALSDNENVRAFAESMLRDHTAVNEQALAVVAALGVTPEDNSLSQALVGEAAAMRAELAGLAGEDFACAYAANELAYHQLVNDTVETLFIPSATVPELRTLLEEALTIFRGHEAHAAAMVAALNCST